MGFLPFTAPPKPKQEKPAEKFPGKLCLLAVLLAAGLFYYASCVASAGNADDPSQFTRLAVSFGKAAQAFPVVLGGILLGLIAPGAILRRGARKYLTRVALLLALAWGALFVAIQHPAAQAAETVRHALSVSRSLPEVIQGH